MLTYRRGA